MDIREKKFNIVMVLAFVITALTCRADVGEMLSEGFSFKLRYPL